MTLSDITNVLKDPSGIDAYSMDEIKELLLDYPNLTQIHAVLMRKRLKEDSVFPSDYANTNYHYSQSSHFVKQVFVIESQELKDDDDLTLQNEDDVEIQVPQSSTAPIVKSAQVAPLTAIKSPESKTENQVQMLTESSENIESIFDRIEASPYANWLTSLKKTSIDTESEEEESHIEDIPDRIFQKEKPINTESESDKVEDNSSVLREEIASQSLAELLAEQGHSQKAIDMYEKLSLIIPEKRAYFAAQIKKIKGK